MIRPVGERVPRLFFVTEDGEAPYYFKETMILPAGTFTKPEDPVPGEAYPLSHHYQTIVYCARMSVKIAPGQDLSKRAVATYRLAEQLGIADLIARTEAAELSVPRKLLLPGEDVFSDSAVFPGGEAVFSEDTFSGDASGSVTLFGTKMEAVRGVTFSDLKMFPALKGYRLYYTPEVTRKLTILMLFDFVCGQIDRHTKNIKYELDIDLDDIPAARSGADRITITDARAIDHDLCFGELFYQDIKERVSAGLCICPELFGQMQYTAVDMPFFEKLCALDEDSFRQDFSDLLSEGEIAAVFERREGLIRAVRRQEEKEEELARQGADFFPRLLRDPAMYGEYLLRMEENAAKKKEEQDFRFSRHPSYLQRLALTHEPLTGGE